MFPRGRKFIALLLFFFISAGKGERNKNVDGVRASYYIQKKSQRNVQPFNSKYLETRSAQSPYPRKNSSSSLSPPLLFLERHML